MPKEVLSLFIILLEYMPALPHVENARIKGGRRIPPLTAEGGRPISRIFSPQLRDPACESQPPP